MRTFILLTILLLASSDVLAEPWEFRQIKNRPGAFVAGLLSGFAAHELGHIITAETRGIDTDFDGVTLVYPDSQMTDAEHLQVASSGFQAQWLVSEAALGYRERVSMGEFGDSYNAGVVASHLTITAAYLTVLMHHEDGDVEGMADATGTANEQIAAMLAIPAILDAWRLFGKDVPPWVPTASIGSKVVGLTIIWTY